MPRGFRTYLKGKILVVNCPKCNRSWNGTRLTEPANVKFLYAHIDAHHHEQAIAEFTLHQPPDDA